MEEKEFLKLAAGVLGMEEERISLDLGYRETEAWDSVAMMSLLMEIEDVSGVGIPIEKVGEIKTLGDLYAYVKG